MYPILYSEAERKYEHLGLGALADAVECHVSEERNGPYELEMRYPANGIHAEELAPGLQILAPNNDQDKGQPFRIYQITRTINNMLTIRAEHVSYLLSAVVATPMFTAQSASTALQRLLLSTPSNNFTAWTDVETSGTFTQLTPAAVRERLLGSSGSILDVFGGEYEWDRWAVKLHAARGADNGATVAYGKNMTALNAQTDNTGLLMAIYPFWYKNETLMEVPGKIVRASGSYQGETIVKAVDFTEDFEGSPTQSQLEDRARAYLSANAQLTPTESIKASFVPLPSAQPVEHVRLCDTVRVLNESAGVDFKAKIVKVKYDVLRERFAAIEVGTARKTLVRQIAGEWILKGLGG